MNRALLSFISSIIQDYGVVAYMYLLKRPLVKKNSLLYSRGAG